MRPSACRYVGLDISLYELISAPVGSYDEFVVADVTEAVPELHGQFDLVISFQVLEHVKPLQKALENLAAYLRPGGRLIAQMSGTFSLFGIANQCIPQSVSMQLLRGLLGRNPETVFPAHYHRCWYTSLAAEFRSWARAEIIPWWRGASYFSFLRVLQAGYVAYEEWARINGHRNLAPYYVVDAVR
jgi:SAM-dependent methyltransferase